MVILKYEDRRLGQTFPFISQISPFQRFHEIFTKRYHLKQKNVTFRKDFSFPVNPDPQKSLKAIGLMCILRFLDFGKKHVPNIAVDCCFSVLFATPFARGRPEINSDHAFKAKNGNVLEYFIVSGEFRPPKLYKR